MIAVEQVEAWFASGLLVRPASGRVNFVDLARALVRLGGAAGIADGAGVGDLYARLGEADHYVFVLVDGLGWNQLQTLPRGSFLHAHADLCLQAVFPSTTATALTSMATAAWPAAHAVPGWWAYLPQRGLDVVPLPFTERGSGRSLDEYGVLTTELFPVPSVWPRLTRRSLSVLPAPLVDSVYSRYASGGHAHVPYEDLPDAITKVAEIVHGAEMPSFTYLYLPQYDGLAHHKGVTHEEVCGLLTAIDSLLADLADRLGGKARLVISADHGMVDTPHDRIFMLAADDPLLALLQSVPSGERTAPIFHVRAGCEKRFAAAFADRFGEHYALLTSAEVGELGLLGPEAPGPTMRERLGTFMAIAPYPVQLYADFGGDTRVRLVGIHGGLTPGEMLIPLILA